MIPAVYVELDRLPLTQTGKLDRAALPAPDGARPALSDVYLAPRDPTEELIADVWRGLLNVDRVGVHDNFFALGGHSLLATQVASRLRVAFGVEVPLADLFDYPTVARLAESVAQRIWAEIDQMSEDEVQQALQDQPGTTLPDEDGATR
jgi:acyl carrier protein